MTDLETISPRLREIIYDMRCKYENEIITLLKSENISNSLLQAIQKDSRPDVIRSASLLLNKASVYYPQILSSLWKHQIEFYQEDVAEFISAIQKRCGFYNYEIAQAAAEEEKSVKGERDGNEKDATYSIKADIVQIIEKNDGTVIGQFLPKTE